MDLRAQAQETVAITERGHYVGRAGRAVDIAAAVATACAGTRLYRPSEPADAAEPTDGAAGPMGPRPRFDVTPETTGAAARRRVESGCADLVLLNFASAKNPGGGFLGGAKAQEEDLARCSALYVCQRTQPSYYAANRAEASMLYTDHLIYSPSVPFFRGEDGLLLDAPFTAAVITSPAPNAGEHLARHPGDHAAVRDTLRRRARQVLRVARDNGHRHLLLGAWGCGVFRNDPEDVATVFGELLAEAQLGGAFASVTFAVFARARERRNLEAFAGRFGGS